jgi:hypothetical protein
MEVAGAFVAILLIVFCLVVVIEFFYIGHSLGKLKELGTTISVQLDQLLLAGGSADPEKDRARLVKEGRLHL